MTALRRRWTLLLALGGAFAVGAAALAWTFLAPQPTSRRDESFTPQQGMRAVASGTFQGADRAHSASGKVTLYQDDRGLVLAFEGYEATSGPLVHFYLSASPDGAFDERTAVKVPVPDGVGGDQATVRGTFSVRAPQGVTPDRAKSVVVWCTRFGVAFGHARLGS